MQRLWQSILCVHICEKCSKNEIVTDRLYIVYYSAPWSLSNHCCAHIIVILAPSTPDPTPQLINKPCSAEVSELKQEINK